MAESFRNEIFGQVPILAVAATAALAIPLVVTSVLAIAMAASIGRQSPTSIVNVPTPQIVVSQPAQSFKVVPYGSMGEPSLTEENGQSVLTIPTETTPSPITASVPDSQSALPGSSVDVYSGSDQVQNSNVQTSEQGGLETRVDVPTRVPTITPPTPEPREAIFNGFYDGEGLDVGIGRSCMMRRLEFYVNLSGLSGLHVVSLLMQDGNGNEITSVSSLGKAEDQYSIPVVDDILYGVQRITVSATKGMHETGKPVMQETFLMDTRSAGASPCK
jgi:hypothetical protein